MTKVDYKPYEVNASQRMRLAVHWLNNIKAINSATDHHFFNWCEKLNTGVWLSLRSSIKAAIPLLSGTIVEQSQLKKTMAIW